MKSSRERIPPFVAACGFVLCLGFLLTLPRGAVAADFALYDQFGDGEWRSTSGSTVLAQSFSSHSSGRYLKSVKVWIRNANESNSGSTSSSYSVSIWTSSSGNPSVKVADLATGVAAGQWSESTTTFTATSDIDLGTGPADYFVVVAGSAGGTVGWKCNATAPTAAEPAGSYAARISSDGGSSWSSLSSGRCAAKFFSMVVTGTDVSVSPTTTTSSTSSSTSTSTTTTTLAPLPPPTITTTSSSPATSSTSTSTSSSTTTLLPATTVTTPQLTATTVDEPVPTDVMTDSTEAPTTTGGGSTASDPTAVDGGAPEDPGPTPDAFSALSLGGYFERDLPTFLSVAARVGDEVGVVLVEVNASGLVPGSPVSVTIRSEPRVVIDGVVADDGTFVSGASLPGDLVPGLHTVTLEARLEGGAMEAVGAVDVDGQGRVAGVLEAARVVPSDSPNVAAISRGMDSGRAIYDPLAQPATTAALAAAAAAVASLAAGGAGGGGTARNEEDRAKLAGFVAKKLKAIASEGTSWGDRGATWKAPFTALTDRWGRELPITLGRFSASLPRIAVDGAWLRASFGSLGYAAWGAVFLAGLAHGAGMPSVVAPSAISATVFAALGLLDSGLGLSALLGTVAGAAMAGNISDSFDVRTLLGMAVLYTGLSPLAHVIRPLRRALGTGADRTERVLDYVICPLFLAFAGGAMLKALNGLSGLALVSADDVSTSIWIFGAVLIVRLLCEDVVAAGFPLRMSEVQPAKLATPLRALAVASVLPRTAVVLFVTVPFFGMTWRTVTSVLLMAVPVVLKAFEDELPNAAFLHRWIPRGLFRFLCLLVLGMWMGSVLVPVDEPDAVRNAAVWLLIPSVVVGILELFGRAGGDWTSLRVKRILGAGVWFAAASLVTGAVTLF